jgi:ligand-binding sensor domain-containing protein
VSVAAAFDGRGADIKAIRETADGSIWIGTFSNGLLRIAGQKTSHYGTRQGLPGNDIRAILEGPDNSIWLSTRRGLVMFRGGRFTTLPRIGSVRARISPICRDHSGSLWIGTEGGGICRMTGNTCSTLTTEDGLASDDIRSVFEDRQGNIWFGSTDGTLFRLREQKFAQFTRRDGLSSNVVTNVFASRNNELWVGTAEGVNQLQGGRIIRPREPWAAGGITSIIQDRAGALWIGTLQQGLRWVRNGKTKLFFPRRSVGTLLEDRDGSIWAGVSPGLVRIRDGRAETVGAGTPVALSRVVAVVQDRTRGIWVGNRSGHLTHIAGTRLATFDLAKYGCPSRLTGLYPGRRGSLWITTGEGLCRFHDGVFEHYSTKDGLAEDELVSVVEDGLGHLWLSGCRGFSRLEIAALLRYRRGASPPLPVWFIERANGEFSQLRTGAAYNESDGSLWFATQRGLVALDPAGAQPNRAPIAAVIEGLSADNSPVALPRSSNALPHLSAGVKDIGFRFTGMDLGSPELVRFKYKLEGFDADWTNAGNRRVAFYTNLPRGSYRFCVMAANSDGVPGTVRCRPW